MTIATTFDVYGHVFPGMREEAAQQFDQGIAKARKERTVEQDIAVFQTMVSKMLAKHKLKSPRNVLRVSF